MRVRVILLTAFGLCGLFVGTVLSDNVNLPQSGDSTTSAGMYCNVGVSGAIQYCGGDDPGGGC
jgi:hypothetical protein